MFSGKQITRELKFEIGNLPAAEKQMLLAQYSRTICANETLTTQYGNTKIETRKITQQNANKTDVQTVTPSLTNKLVQPPPNQHVPGPQ